MSKVEYEVRVLGPVGPAAREAARDVAVGGQEPSATVLSGALDQAALHGLLERIQALGLSSSTFVGSECGSKNCSPAVDRRSFRRRTRR